MPQDAKKSFVLYNDYRSHLALLTNEQRGQLLMALFDYSESRTPPDLDAATMMAFSFIACQMDRDAEKYAEKVRKRREAGRQGGRPPKANESTENQEEAKKANAFSEKQTEAKKPDNDNVNDNDTDNVNDNESNNINIITSSSPKSPHGEAPDGAAAAAADHTPYKAIVALYHDICKSYPKLSSVTAKRKRAMAARFKEHGHDLDTFRELFEKAEASPFLKGKNKRNWSADFNWLMESENMAKVLENTYNTENGGHSNANHSASTERHEPPAGAPLSGFRMADE